MFARCLSACCTVMLVFAAACGGDKAPTAPTSPPAVSGDPAPSAPPNSITFAGSTPSPGSEVVISDDACCLRLEDLTLRFHVRSDVALPDAKLEIDLLDSTGQICFRNFVDRAVPANQTVSIDVKQIFPERENCPAFPIHIAEVKATLLTLREPLVNARLQRTDYVTQSFQIGYIIHRWPPPPVNAAPAPPVIADMYWKGPWNQPPDSPLPGDAISVFCKITETDGAPITATVSVLWDGRTTPVVRTESFPAGASSSPQGILAWGGGPAAAYHAVATCLATNARGETATRTIDVGSRR